MIEFDKPPEPKCDKIFVYCDLKHKGKQNSILISNGCRLLGRTKLRPFVMYNILNSYPIIVPTAHNDANVIVGELWSIGHPNLLSALDKIKSPMVRDTVYLTFEKNTVKAWVYYMPDTMFNNSASGVRKNKDGKWKV